MEKVFCFFFEKCILMPSEVENNSGCKKKNKREQKEKIHCTKRGKHSPKGEVRVTFIYLCSSFVNDAKEKKLK